MVSNWKVVAVTSNCYLGCQTKVSKPSRKCVSGSGRSGQRDSRSQNVSFVSCASGRGTTGSTVVLVNNCVGSSFPPCVQREVLSFAVGVGEPNYGSSFSGSPTKELKPWIGRICWRSTNSRSSSSSAWKGPARSVVQLVSDAECVCTPNGIEIKACSVIWCIAPICKTNNRTINSSRPTKERVPCSSCDRSYCNGTTCKH